MAVAPDRHRGPGPGAVSAAAQPRNRHQTPAAVRLHARGSAAAARADGRAGRGAARLDGHRHVAGGVVGSSAHALRLLQAGLRTGHQPAARRHPRGARHVDGVDDRARGQPARSTPRVVPADRGQISIIATTAREAAALYYPGSTDSHSDAFDVLEGVGSLERAMDHLNRRPSTVEAGYTS